MPPRREDLLAELVALYLAEGFLAFGVGELAARLRCSRTTLYGIAPSKDEIVTAAVRTFFRQATERIETRLARAEEPVAQLHAYLGAIGDELAPATEAFFADLDAFAPAREIYRHNTEYAARRVRQLVSAIPRPRNGDDLVDPVLVGFIAAGVMQAIQRGELEAVTGLDDAAAYHQLATLLARGVSAA